jgi:hypothetical protein
MHSLGCGLRDCEDGASWVQPSGQHMPSIGFSDVNTAITTTAANLRTLRLYVPRAGRLTRTYI